MAYKSVNYITESQEAEIIVVQLQHNDLCFLWLDYVINTSALACAEL